MAMYDEEQAPEKPATNRTEQAKRAGDEKLKKAMRQYAVEIQKGLDEISTAETGLLKRAIEVGKILKEAKKTSKYDKVQWRIWLKDNFPKSHRVATDYMRLAANQKMVKSASSIRDALKLLPKRHRTTSTPSTPRKPKETNAERVHREIGEMLNYRPAVEPAPVGGESPDQYVQRRLPKPLQPLAPLVVPAEHKFAEQGIKVDVIAMMAALDILGFDTHEIETRLGYFVPEAAAKMPPGWATRRRANRMPPTKRRSAGRKVA